MLPPGSRLTRREDFRSVVRRGSRSGRRTLVVHALLGQPAPGRPGTVQAGRQVGFVVSGAVGGSVVRHRVVRRLRHLVAARLDGLPPGCLLVVRALPASASASSAELAADLDAALRRLRLLPADVA